MRLRRRRIVGVAADVAVVIVGRQVLAARAQAELGIEEPTTELEDRDETWTGDDRLRLIFTCCHPALAVEAQVALTLRTVCGLTTEEIAHAFLVPAPTLAQAGAS